MSNRIICRILKSDFQKLKYLDNTKRIQKCHYSLTKLKERGFIQDVFPHESVEIARVTLGRPPQAIYAGFDPTADSLHVGNLLIIIGLIHWQREGHQPIALLGGATGKIGDPSGRNTERNLIESDTVDKNLSSIGSQIGQIFRNHQELFWNTHEKPLKNLLLVNNANWYKDTNFVDFISNYGRHFRMGSMLSRASVQSRLQSEAGMSFTEFTYQIFQAYDWLHLFKNFDCKFQLGGSDQMGNIMSGHELVSKVTKKQVFGVTLPLITNEEGNKFGKSAGNAVWLDSKKTSEFSFYQFFIRMPDSEVEKLLRLLTFLPLNEVNDIMEVHKRTPELKTAQKRLARELTMLIHGKEGLENAEKISMALYSGDINTLGELEPQEVSRIFEGAAYKEILMEPGTTILDAALKAKCFLAEKDAVRIIVSGGFYVNQKRTSNISEIFTNGVHILKNGISILRVGKKNYYIVKWV